ncbi:hypothetical protein CK936_06580 [Streptomyces albireticuli]|uniref:Uncharacterized protein n=1 Tax=Streptomyces albireticuli TaxID=1940 RepID=A0A2A2DB07_9ACTN|nr:hypothetical protein CK936_06580 [Streptomyces albireticuli]
MSGSIWAIWGLLFAALEIVAIGSKRRIDTLSESVRKLFYTRTSRIGRVLFAAGWASFSVWFLWHILE